LGMGAVPGAGVAMGAGGVSNGEAIRCDSDRANRPQVAKAAPVRPN
jgi:hypothetical protein